MTSLRLFLPATVALLAPLAAPAPCQVLDAPGFARTDVLDLGADRAYATLPDGGFLSFDGVAFELYAADGTWQQTLDTLSSYAFPSFVRLHPSATWAVVGESSNGVLYRVDLASATVAPLATLAYNYDLAWDPSGATAYVSASLGGFGNGNDLVRVDAATGATEAIAHLVGPSGPLACDASGALFYVTQYEGFDWPPPLEQEELLRWSAAQVAAAGAGNLLDESDAQVLTTQLDGGSSLVFDGHAERLLLAHVNAQGAFNEVLALGLDGTVLDVLGGAYTWIQNLEPVHGGGDAVLAAHQPANDAVLVQNTDFGSNLRQRARLEPARPVASWSGPSQGQSGPATVSFEGLEPDATVSIFLARTSKLLPQEAVHDLGWGAPVFTAIELSDVLRRTPRLATDASGAASLTYTQTPELFGQLVFQAIVFDAGGLPLGTSTFVLNQ